MRTLGTLNHKFPYASGLSSDPHTHAHLSFMHSKPAASIKEKERKGEKKETGEAVLVLTSSGWAEKKRDLIKWMPRGHDPV